MRVVFIQLKSGPHAIYQRPEAHPEVVVVVHPLEVDGMALRGVRDGCGSVGRATVANARNELPDGGGELARRSEKHALQSLRIARVKCESPGADRLVIEIKQLFQYGDFHIGVVESGN